MNTTYKPLLPCRGFSLVELMIAMLLGLFLVGGVISVFLSSRQVYRQNENLARIQENARYANEVVGRSIREAAGIPCGSNMPTANVLNNPAANWWSNWGDGIRGYEGTETLPAQATGTGATQRVAGTDAVYVLSGTGSSFVTIVAHSPDVTHSSTATLPIFTANVSTHGFSVGDILMACNYTNAALFQVTSISGNDIRYQASTSISPGNTANLLPLLGRNPLATPTPPNPDPSHPAIGQLGKLSAHAWYVGFNGRGGGRSLYRVALSRSGSNAATVIEEFAEGVTNLQLQYLAKDASGNLPVSYVDATSITHWTRVVAVRMVLTLQSLENVGTGNAALTRTWNTVITLRNRAL